MSKKRYTTLTGDIVSVHMKHIRFFGDWGDYANIPISVIEDGDALEEQDDVNINVESWFCEKEGIG